MFENRDGSLLPFHHGNDRSLHGAIRGDPDEGHVIIHRVIFPYRMPCWEVNTGS